MVDTAQMIVSCRLLAVGWKPADPNVVGALAPHGVRVHADHRAVLSQYVVDTAIQTSGLGAHSATLIGIDLAGGDEPQQVPPRLWVGAVASTPEAQEFFAARGIPTELGRTTIEFRGETVVATTQVDDLTAVHCAARVGVPSIAEAGARTYLRIGRDGGLVEEAHPWIATLSDQWQLTDLDFTGATGVFARLAPPQPALAEWGFYSPNASFCFPAAGRAVSGARTADDPWAGRFSREQRDLR